MRALLLVILVLFGFSAPAHANRVMEVQNIRIDGSANRDAAVAEATRQAAQQVWTQLGRNTPLPTFTPTQLQTIATYVDVTNEVAQPNYYAGSFNIGIHVDSLQRIGSGQRAMPTADNSAAGAYTQDQADGIPVQHTPPSWVLIITGRSIAGTVTLWSIEDEWSKAWQRAPSTGTSTAVATGDSADQVRLKPSMLQEYDPMLADALRALARKYGAPAVALVMLDSQRPEIGLNEEVEIELTYLEKDMPDVLTSKGTLFVTSTAIAGTYNAAVTEGQKLLAGLVNGTAGNAQAQAIQPGGNYSYQPANQVGIGSQFGNTYSNAAAPVDTGSKLWVRIPLSSPADLGNYRRKIEAIPGARFEVIALNRMYVEGNILYNGDQNTLMQQLATAGLRQQ